MFATENSRLLKRVRAFAGSAGLVILAVAALLSGSDRQSRDYPNSPGLVGWPYDTGAARAKAAIAFVRGGPASAIGYARRAIISDPISAQAVSILGRTELLSQHQLEARKAFQVSGQLGWRDPMTQIYWLDQALQAEDYKVAAERLDALLRQAPSDENRDRLLAAVTKVEAGRAALAERMKLAPPWAAAIVKDLQSLPKDQLLQRADLVKRVGASLFQCQASENLIQRVIDFNLLNEARAVWDAACPSSHSFVYDGDFDHLDILRKTSAFDWQISTRGDAEIAVITDGTGNRSLQLGSSAAITLPIIRQLTVLRPGRYLLTWRALTSDARQDNAIRVSLGCSPDLSEAAPGRLLDAQRKIWAAAFLVDSKCAARWLTFWLSQKTSAQIDEVSIDAIERI